MNSSTLALAYAAKTGRAPAAQPQPAQRSVSLQAALPISRPAPPRTPAAPTQPAKVISDDALLIAVRRSLASCRDSSQLRMLAAFEPSR